MRMKRKLYTVWLLINKNSQPANIESNQNIKQESVAN